MSMDRKIRLIAGTMILISLALAVWGSEWWLLFTAFIGENLLQSSITNWCLMEDILRATKIHTDRRDSVALGANSPNRCTSGLVFK